MFFPQVGQSFILTKKPLLSWQTLVPTWCIFLLALAWKYWRGIFGKQYSSPSSCKIWFCHPKISGKFQASKWMFQNLYGCGSRGLIINSFSSITTRLTVDWILPRKYILLTVNSLIVNWCADIETMLWFFILNPISDKYNKMPWSVAFSAQHCFLLMSGESLTQLTAFLEHSVGLKELQKTWSLH